MRVRGTGQLIDREALQAARVAAGHTQSSLARATGIGQSYLSQLELGRRNVVRPDTLAILAEALEVEPEKLKLEGDRVPPRTKPNARRADGRLVVAG